MEYLDIYDDKGNCLGKELRDIVHKKGLWHKTVHCWLYDKLGNIFFQIRKDTNTLYTTASGHLLAGESISEGFRREIKEEIGIDIDASDAILVKVDPFMMDKKMKDGSIFKDRALANVYVDLYEGNYQDFLFDEEEVLGVVMLNANLVLEMFKNESGLVKGKMITSKQIIEKSFGMEDFLVNEGETALGKYGDILKKIIYLQDK